MEQIFISYVREDRESVAPLAAALQARGFTLWWDVKMPPGAQYQREIEKRIAASKAVIVVWSSRSVQSDWVHDEANEGKKRGILIPISLDPAIEPPMGFRSFHAIDFSASISAGAKAQAIDDLCAELIAKGLALSSPVPVGSPLPSVAPARQQEPRDEPPRPASHTRAISLTPSATKPLAPLERPAWITQSRFLAAVAVGGVLTVSALFWLRPQPQPTEPPALAQVPSSATQSPAQPSASPSAASAPTPPSRPRPERDCPECPELVVVPAGSFMMGSDSGASDEKPIHRVTISRPLAVGKFEVTFAEWDACVAAQGCKERPDDRGWGRDRRPVINVSWDHAQHYVSWLSQRTGKTYRLLSEAEWEYAARGGSPTEVKGERDANVAGTSSQWGGKQTAPVGSFAPNGFGLYDMIGNVWEWTEDCWNESYENAPSDGNAWRSGKCERRVLRGGSWGGGPWFARSAVRDYNGTANRYGNAGFRVARTL